VAAGAVSYQVSLRDVTGGVASVFPGATTTGTSWSPPADLVSGHAYQVAVRPLFSNRDGPWSSFDSFQVARPILSGLDGPISNATPTFTWTGVDGTTKYVLIVADLTTGQRVLAIPTTGTSWTPAAQMVDGHLYGWRVAARNTAGFGAWSDLTEFRLDD
jgi:hypothetical protein